MAAEWAGFTTVGQCEWADYPTKVLEKHWPDVPRWRDIRTLTKESFYERTGLHTVDIISGGFPCQPFSVAGNQQGKDDERYLWPEMLRVIREIKPSWIVGENVPGILRIAADDVCQDMEREGYEVGIFNYEAAAVGAMHRRERFFFVAHSDNTRLEGWNGEILSECPGELPVRQSGTYMADAKSGQGWQNVSRIQQRSGGGLGSHDGQNGSINNWWKIEPNVGRVANGIPNRVDRLKCLGNAVVPQQAYPIFRAITEIEGSGR